MLLENNFSGFLIAAAGKEKRNSSNHSIENGRNTFFDFFLRRLGLEFVQELVIIYDDDNATTTMILMLVQLVD